MSAWAVQGATWVCHAQVRSVAPWQLQLCLTQHRSAAKSCSTPQQLRNCIAMKCAKLHTLNYETVPKGKKRLQLTNANSAFGAWKCYFFISNLLSCPEPKQTTDTVNLMQGRDQSQTVLSLRTRLDPCASYRTTIQLHTPVTNVKPSPRSGK